MLAMPHLQRLLGESNVSGKKGVCQDLYMYTSVCIIKCHFINNGTSDKGAGHGVRQQHAYVKRDCLSKQASMPELSFSIMSHTQIASIMFRQRGVVMVSLTLCLFKDTAHAWFNFIYMRNFSVNNQSCCKSTQGQAE